MYLLMTVQALTGDLLMKSVHLCVSERVKDCRVVYLSTTYFLLISAEDCAALLTASSEVLEFKRPAQKLLKDFP